MSSSAGKPHPFYPPPPACAPPSCYETFGNRLRTFFDSRLFLILVMVSTLLAILYLVITSSIFGARDPEFAVSSACVTGFNLSAQQQQLSASFDLNLTVHSPNRQMRIYYEHGITSMLYGSYILSEKTLVPFDQGAGETTVIRVRLAVLGEYVNSDVVRGIESDRGRGDGAVGFNVRVFSVIRFQSRTRWSHLSVNCNDVLIGFGNGTNEATTGYLLGSASKKCVVISDVGFHIHLPNKRMIDITSIDLQKANNKDIRTIINSAMRSWHTMKGKHLGAFKMPIWKELRCQKQTGNTECGYYVMRHMLNIVSAIIVDSWDKDLLTINWDAIPETVVNETKMALSKATEDKAAQEVLANVFCAAEESVEFSGVLVSLRMALDLCGFSGENVGHLPKHLEDAIRAAYKRYITYLD